MIRRKKFELSKNIISELITCEVRNTTLNCLPSILSLFSYLFSFLTYMYISLISSRLTLFFLYIGLYFASYSRNQRRGCHHIISTPCSTSSNITNAGISHWLILSFRFSIIIFRIFSKNTRTMASAVINQYGLTLHDVNTEIKQEKIEKLLRRFLPNGYIKTNPGKIYCKYLIKLAIVIIKSEISFLY